MTIFAQAARLGARAYYFLTKTAFHYRAMRPIIKVSRRLQLQRNSIGE